MRTNGNNYKKCSETCPSFQHVVNMRNLKVAYPVTVALLFLLTASALRSQKAIDGLYAGPFLSPFAVFSIAVKDSTLTGHLFFSNYESFPVNGRYDHDLSRIRGFFLKDNVPHVIVGTFSNDTLLLKLLSNESGTVISQSSLLRKTTNPKANALKLFAETKPQFDGRLIGTWIPIKTIRPTASTHPPVEYTQTFHSGGMVTVNSQALEDIKNRAKNKQMLPIYDWQTLDGNLIIKRSVPMGMGAPQFPGPDVTVDRYTFRGDTLVIINARTQTYFLKKD